MLKKKEGQGFTLLEIMIVVAVIGLLAAIAIPNLLRLRLNANEGSAQRTLHTLVTAMESYRAAQPTPAFPTGLDVLTNSPALPPYFTVTLTNTTTFQKSGYQFQLLSADANNYLMHGTPVTINATGQNYFCSDQSGVIQKSAVGFMTDQTKCRVLCGAGEDYDSSTDVCHAACTGGTSWDSGTSACECPSGEESDGTICHEICEEGTTWNSSTVECEADAPECPEGQTWDGDQCYTPCPGNQTWNGSACACPSGETWQSNCNTCAVSETFNPVSCSACSSGQIFYADGSMCGPVCTGGQSWSSPVASCVCPSGTIWDSSYSTCHEDCGARTWNGSACVCPSGQEWDSMYQSCHAPCVGGASWNGSDCACPMPQEWDGTCNLCHSASWDTSQPPWNSETCSNTCPSGTEWRTSCGFCGEPCAEGLTFNQGSCACTG